MIALQAFKVSCFGLSLSFVRLFSLANEFGPINEMGFHDGYFRPSQDQTSFSTRPMQSDQKAENSEGETAERSGPNKDVEDRRVF